MTRWRSGPASPHAADVDATRTDERLHPVLCRGCWISIVLGLGVIAACEREPTPSIPYIDDRAPLLATPDEDAGDSGSRALTEREKILQLIDVLRRSDVVVVRNGVEYSATQGAEHLEMKVAYAGAKLQTAEQFVVHIATRSSMSGKPYFIRTPDGQEHLAGDWFYAQLARLRTPPRAASTSPHAASADVIHPPQDPIARTLDLVSASDATFVVAKSGKPDKAYSGSEFASMLRTKTRWLGEGIDDLHVWQEEIAVRSFASYEPYRVEYADGRTETFAAWLERLPPMPSSAKNPSADPEQ